MSSNKSADAHILLVDDNREGLTARKSVLEELGFKIVTATSAHVALDLFGRHAFDLVVTDYKMPDMSGIEFIQKIRKSKPAIPVILISGFVDVLGLDSSTTGADIVMAKNANEVNHLVRSVTRLLNRKRPPGNAGGVAAKRQRKTG
jgi:CheY-like chemotaxis protein